MWDLVKESRKLLWCIVTLSTSLAIASDSLIGTQYICVRDSLTPYGSLIFDEVNQKIPPTKGAQIRVGVGATFHPLYINKITYRRGLNLLLSAAEQTNTPVIVYIDVELDLDPAFLNWWDPAQKGYDPNKVNNVEWYGWGPQYAVKVCWRNWGTQMRILPPQNYMSPAYRTLCHNAYDLCVPMLVTWWNNLPANKKNLFIGLEVGSESGGALGPNTGYYVNGNYYIETWPNDTSHDPTSGPMETLGYAAVKTLHPERNSGPLTEADLAEVAYTHLEDLCQIAMSLGLPRDKILTHGQTYMGSGPNTYSAVNNYSCPGWSYYGANPGGPRVEYPSLNNAVATSGAPAWCIPEFWWQGAQTTNGWRGIMETILDPTCRYLDIANWNSMNTNETILKAIRLIENSSSSHWIQLSYDNFESGWGNYTVGGIDCSRYAGAYAHQGGYAANIQDNSGTASSFSYTNSIDVHTPGYTQIKIDFWFKTVSMESGEDFWVQYYDGSTWRMVASYSSGTNFDNNTFYHETVYIDEPNYTFPTNMKIRFQCDASENDDDIYIDEIEVSGWLENICGDTEHPYPVGDLNNDCYVNMLDLAMFAEQWLNCTTPAYPLGDLNNNHCVDMLDFAMFANQWLSCTDPGLPCSYNP